LSKITENCDHITSTPDFDYRKPIAVENFVELVRKQEIPERNEFRKLEDADSKYHVFQVS
jgi:hypothetical protein